MKKNNMLSHFHTFKRLLATVSLLFCLFPGRVTAQVTLGFQGAEPGDTWTFVSTGADAVAQAQAFMGSNIVTGSASLVAGGNTAGGNCFDVGTGNGPNTPRTFTFDNLNISSSSSFTRTLQFNWGNRFPVCVGTGWDASENLVFTAFHDGVAQPSVTLATGVNNAVFNINANQYTWNVPPCVNNFYFTVSVTTNRRDELLFLDDVKLTAPALNSPLSMPSPIVGDFSVCTGAIETYSVTQESGLTYTWSGLPAGASFTTANGTTASYTIGVNWGAASPGTYTLSVIPSDPCGGTGPAQTANVTITTPITISITPSGPTTFCAGGSVTLTSSEASGNTWSTGSTAPSIVVTTSGTITLTVATGCGPVTASQTVTVNPLPVVVVNNAVTCPGVPATLTAAGASTYTWSPAGGLSATTGSSVSATALSTASYTVTGTDGAGCENTALATVTVNPFANATINPQTPLCANGGTVTLTAAQPGGSWTSSCACINTATGVFDPAAAGAGTHTVTYTIPGTCGDTSAISIVVNPVPDVNALPQTICSGQSTSVALSSSVAGTGFSWTVSPTNVSGASNDSGTSIAQSLNVNTPPSGTVVYTITPSAAGCTGTPLNVTVTVQDVSIDNVIITPVSCNGLLDGGIEILATGATQYSIDGGGTYQASPVFTPLAPVTYNIIVQNAIGCNNSTMVNVTEPAVLTASVSGTDETCLGSCNGTATAAVGGGTTPYTYNWSNAAGNFVSIGSLCTGTYSVVVTDSSGCTQSDTIVIGSLSGVSIDSVIVTDVSCNGGTNGTITIYTTPAAAQFSIDGGATFQPSGSFTGLAQGTYAIVAEHASGCQATTSATVAQPGALVLNTSPDVIVCPGQSTVISATATGGTAPYTITWDHGLADSTAHSVSPAATDTYSVFVTDAQGCVSPAHVIVLTVPAALSVTASVDQTICPGASAFISANATGGLAPHTYTWTNNLNGTVLTGADQLVTPVAAAIYVVTVQDNCGTTVTDTVKIDLHHLPLVTFTVDSGRGCLPLVVNFTSTTATVAGDVLSWNFGDGNTGAGSLTQHVFGTAGCFDVTLQVTTAQGCVSDTTVLNSVCVYGLPLADFTFTPVPADIYNPEINFVNLSMDANGYQWDFTGLGSSSMEHPSFVFPTDSAGSYQVCLAVTSPAGCVDTTCQVVNITGDVTVYVPNAFTPDGDGINDYFFPVCGDIVSEAFTVLVFNRWGNIVFETHDLAGRWDGTENGLRCKADTYVWKVKYREGTTGVDKEVVGHVNLLR